VDIPFSQRTLVQQSATENKNCHRFSEVLNCSRKKVGLWKSVLAVSGVWLKIKNVTFIVFMKAAAVTDVP
jgi:hypothetical protein